MSSEEKPKRLIIIKEPPINEINNPQKYSNLETNFLKIIIRPESNPTITQTIDDFFNDLITREELHYTFSEIDKGLSKIAKEHRQGSKTDIIYVVKNNTKMGKHFWNQVIEPIAQTLKEIAHKEKISPDLKEKNTKINLKLIELENKFYEKIADLYIKDKKN